MDTDFGRDTWVVVWVCDQIRVCIEPEARTQHRLFVSRRPVCVSLLSFCTHIAAITLVLPSSSFLSVTFLVSHSSAWQPHIMAVSNFMLILQGSRPKYKICGTKFSQSFCNLICTPRFAICYCRSQILVQCHSSKGFIVFMILSFSLVTKLVGMYAEQCRPPCPRTTSSFV